MSTVVESLARYGVRSLQDKNTKMQQLSCSTDGITDILNKIKIKLGIPKVQEQFTITGVTVRFFH